ncbi:YfiR family protein [Massilia putida]|uniref:YfiR family protein n=1 Tax=Massilia putida TaxID=1141883 RepID=UPI000950BCB2|nr:YfiR family protein [Massilia putida]
MFRVLALLAIVSGLGLAAGMCRAQVDGADLKSAYIFNFAMFTTWPDANTKAPLVVCASPDNPLWPGLHALSGKPVNGRPWTVTELAHPKAPRCDIAVLARTTERPAALTTGVLVVRDGAGSKAAITLVEDDEHIRFDIDTQEAARSGLRFSSHLLRLARNVL